MDSHRETRSGIQPHDGIQPANDHTLVRLRAVDMVQQSDSRHEIGVALRTQLYKRANIQKAVLGATAARGPTVDNPVARIVGCVGVQQGRVDEVLREGRAVARRVVADVLNVEL